jgi:hypothetical protein
LLILSLNKIRDKGKIVSAGSRGGGGGEGGGRGIREGVGEGGRNDPNIACTYELKNLKNKK